MRVHKGDVLRFTGRTVGTPEHRAKVLEVLGREGDPPYRIRFEDGREAEVVPGSDCVVESGAPRPM
ncbi:MULTISPECIES: DUF1918 domain-containing protein [Streptomycetaceae]|uniref:DUF1918 domain-containing protein n=2 Tax=Actinacidiphila TaxID=2995702 RepID=A0A1H8J5Z1_9ACTN|nr:MULTISPECIES: DUF1918 domain-containing protein [Streptomycetaceae]MBY8879045.1 DUF1918 domain-containing protein [Streptomyces acidipaludis]MCL2553736.1 DUF1918 domain-containing protein [Actinomycetes bacterium]MCL2728838.1 DUF1918 domain-containing protein [Actinomycetes bacterium]SEN75706.1 protein of unknown function [Actinacidiphila rubida]